MNTAMATPMEEAGFSGSADSGSPRRPHSDSLELGALAGAVPSARLHARHVLLEWGLSDLAQTAEVVVSELVTNAVQATQQAGTADPVRLSLLADDTSVLIVVSDAVPDPPRPRRAGPADEDGRGLMIVETLSDWWDWKPARGGKLVRALVTSELRAVTRGRPDAGRSRARPAQAGWRSG